MTAGAPVIVVEGMRKAFGPTLALQGVDLVVERGTVHALLGRNGAGKSTLVRILSTLLAPDAGSARIGGADVVREAQRARALIGLAGQFAAVDETLTGCENLELVGRLYGLGRREARARAAEVLERLSLTAAADRRVLTYSGGMRRRLDLGASLVGRPAVLLMDEPTTGLDPATRRELWGLVDDLAREGTTVLLTTQYLEEADRLANRIAVIEQGRIIASGTPSELKDRLGQDVFEVRAQNTVDVERLRRLLAGLGAGEPVADLRWHKVTLPTTNPVATLLSAGSRIGESGIAVEDLGWRRPTLDDVFLSLTSGAAGGAGNGAAASSPQPPGPGEEPSGRSSGRRHSPRRFLSYAAVAAVAAGLVIAIIAVFHKPPKSPPRAAPTPTVASTHKPKAASAGTGTVASIAGITLGRTVALKATPAGLTADASGNLWVTLPGSGAVAHVTAATGRTQTFQVGGHPTAIAAAFDRVWVAGSALGPLASLNEVNGQPLNTTQLQSAPTAIVLDTDDNSACTIDASGTLTHIDSTGVVLGTARLSHPATAVSCGEGWVWAVEPSPPALIRMGDYGGTRQFNGGPAPVAITFDQGAWIANSDGVVTAFDPRSNYLRVTRQLTVAPSLDGIYANENDSSVWAISKQTKTLYRIFEHGTTLDHRHGRLHQSTGGARRRPPLGVGRDARRKRDADRILKGRLRMADEDLVHEAVERLEWDERKEGENPSARRRQFTRRAALTGGAAGLAALALQACGGGSDPAASASSGRSAAANIFGVNRGYHFTFVNHATTNTFFTPAINGAADACKLLGCSYQWTGSQASNVSEMVNAIDTAVTQRTNGIATTLIDPTAFNAPVSRALSAGVPVVAYNSDVPGNARLAYIGMDNYGSGQTLGQRIASLVPSGDITLFIATPGQVNLQPRIDGALAALKSYPAIAPHVVPTGAAQPQELPFIKSYMSTRPTYRGFFAVDGGSTAATGQAMEQAALAAKGIKGGGYDLISPTEQLVAAGHLQFTIDQQPYLQGFLPILELYLYNASENLVGIGDCATGPKFVDRSGAQPYVTAKTRYEGTGTAAGVRKA